MTTESNGTQFIDQTTSIVSAYVGNHVVRPDEIAGIIGQVHAALAKVSNGHGEANGHVKPLPAPAVAIGKSITPDYIICLEDGQKFRSLKRHLRKLNMTPEEYRAKWGLPANYPMVAPSYSQQRSQLARKMGLGQRVLRRANGKKPRRAAGTRVAA